MGHRRDRRAAPSRISSQRQRCRTARPRCGDAGEPRRPLLTWWLFTYTSFKVLFGAWLRARLPRRRSEPAGRARAPTP
jgi:hypothetical protein